MNGLTHNHRAYARAPEVMDITKESLLCLPEELMGTIEIPDRRGSYYAFSHSTPNGAEGYNNKFNDIVNSLEQQGHVLEPTVLKGIFG